MRRRERRWRTLRWVCSTALLALLCLAPAVLAGGARPVRPLSGEASGRLRDFFFTADGAHVVFRFEEAGGLTRIYSTDADGYGAPRSLGVQSVYERLLLSPDGERVLFLSGALISHPVRGGKGAVLARDVTDFAITPDSDTVVFTGWRIVGSAQDLYAAPINGGEARRLNPPAGRQQGVSDFAISADGRYVVFSADLGEDTVTELYAAPLPPLDGGSAVKLSQPLAANSDIVFAGEDFQITPDGQTVVYRATESGSAREGLFAVPAGGGDVRMIGMVPDEGGFISRFFLTADSERVIFEANSWAGTAGSTIYTALIGGGLAQPLASGQVDLLQLDPKGRWVLARRIGLGIGQELVHYELLPVAGGTARSLAGPFTSVTNKFPEYGLWQTSFTPDGRTVVFQGRERQSLNTYAAALRGHFRPVRLMAQPGQAYAPFQLTADGRFLVQIASDEPGGRETLLRLALDGSGVDRLIVPPPAFAGRPAFQISPDGKSVAYGAQTEDGGEGLFLAAPFSQLLPFVR